MKQSKKLLSLALALTMGLSLATPAMAADETKTETGKIVILHTNDVHCGIDQAVKENEETGEKTVTNIGYAGVAAYKAEMEAQYGEGNVTLVDAGDAIQGGPIGTLTKGAAIVEIMNEVGYDLAIPGNHEFDYGMDNFLSLAKDTAKYPYICANFTDLKGNAVFDAYKVVTYGEVKVAYVGIDTPETFAKSTPTFFQDGEGNYIYGFQQGNEGKDLYECVQKAVDAAKKDGADYVVAMGHLGDNGSTEEWKAQSVIANTTGIDVFIDGHSHEEIGKTVANKDGKDVVWAQTGTKLANIGKIVIDTETKEITHELVSGYDKQDEAVAAFVKEKNDAFEAELKKVVATSEVELTVNGADGKRAIRNGETNLGDLCADAYLTMLEADVAIVNGGGIRANIAAGEVTYEDIINVHPFGNEGCLVETKGQNILDALEMASRLYPEECGGFLQVAGLTYTINASIPSSVVLSDEGEFVKVDGDYRVTDVMVAGEPLDLEKTYTVASHNYMLKDGGDGLVMFKTSNLLKDSVMIDNAILINYIVEALEGKVTEAQYGASQGRILFVPADVAVDAWYYNVVKETLATGLMQGTDKGFEALTDVTVASVLQTLYNAQGKPDATDAEVWYTDAVNWATKNELVKEFTEDAAATRGEVKDILDAYCAMLNVTPESPLMKGNENGDLMLDKTLTRSEFAQILVNLSQLPMPLAD